MLLNRFCFDWDRASRNTSFLWDTFSYLLYVEAALFSKTGSIDPANFGPKLDNFQEPRFLEQVKLFFDRAASKTDIPQEYLNLIKACNTVIRFNIPLRRDNGTIETITCYR